MQNDSSIQIKPVLFFLICFSIFLLLTSNFVTAQSGKITGTVKEKSTGDPLPGANCSLIGTSLGSATDLNGEFSILNVTPGSYTLKVMYIGYTQQEIEVQVKSGSTTILDVDLQSTAITLGDEVVITAQREGQVAAINQQLTADAIKNVVSAERIKEVPDANAAESVGRLPGISLGRSGGEGNKVIVRGLSAKYSTVSINGVSLPAAGSSDDRSTDISMISNENLSGIEVFKALTADMDADAIGGVVNLQLAKANNKPMRSVRLFGIYNVRKKMQSNIKWLLTGANEYWRIHLVFRHQLILNYEIEQVNI